MAMFLWGALTFVGVLHVVLQNAIGWAQDMHPWKVPGARAGRDVALFDYGSRFTAGCRIFVASCRAVLPLIAFCLDVIATAPRCFAWRPDTPEDWWSVFKTSVDHFWSHVNDPRSACSLGLSRLCLLFWCTVMVAGVQCSMWTVLYLHRWCPTVRVPADG